MVWLDGGERINLGVTEQEKQCERLTHTRERDREREYREIQVLAIIRISTINELNQEW